MPRDLPLGNQRMLVAFDQSYALRDLHFPRVGLENQLMGRPSRIALGTESGVTWVGSDGWTGQLLYEDGALISRVAFTHEAAGLRLLATDAVHAHLRILVRSFRVENLRGSDRSLALFVHTDPDLLESDAFNAACYDPKLRAILHYKRDRYLLLGLRSGDGRPMDSFACDARSTGGGRGTAGQLETHGSLSGNAVAIGPVDSTCGVTIHLGPRDSAPVEAWICAGHDRHEVARLHSEVERSGVKKIIDGTRVASQAIAARSRNNDLPVELGRAVERSILTIFTQIDHGGAILAANDSDTLDPGRETYSYLWPRDGALVADALDRSGHRTLIREFFQLCADLLEPAGYFLHRYHADGTPGSSWLPWLRHGRLETPIQEDETALVIWALGRAEGRRAEPDWMEALYERLVRPAANWMVEFRDASTGLPRESWDLWEERYAINTFTVASVEAALREASAMAVRRGDEPSAARWLATAKELAEGISRYLYHEELERFARCAYPSGDGNHLDTTVDASLCGLVTLETFPADAPQMASTLDAVGRHLSVPSSIGGFARYENDPFLKRAEDPAIPGNPWFVCTLWWAECEARRSASTAELERRALPWLEWAMARALPSGIMPEQIDPNTGEPVGVSPLTWSHAAFVAAATTYAERRAHLERS